MFWQNSNRYRIEKQIGVGGMGRIYKAYDSKLARVVAIKVMIDNENHEGLERFRREIAAIAKLRHPNVIQLYDVGQEQGKPFFTMDYIEGDDLSSLIKRKKISPKKAAQITKKISDALYHAHQQGIVHRDLKPSNVMINKQSEPILMDFGLAKMDKESNLTKTGTVIGTLFYMSPEQAGGKSREIDGQSDVYSLGVILYEMLTGFAPFRGNSTVEIITKISRETPKRPCTVNTRLDKNLEKICLQAMAKDKQNRYQTAKDLCDDLNRYLNKQPVLAKAPFKITLDSLKQKKVLILNALVILIFCIYIGFSSTVPKSKKIKNKATTVPKSKKIKNKATAIDFSPTKKEKHKKKRKKYKRIELVSLKDKNGKLSQKGLQIMLRKVQHKKRKNIFIFATLGYSQLRVHFNINKIPRKLFLRIRHHASKNRGAKIKNFAPVNIILNGRHIEKDYNPGHSFTILEREITSKAKKGKNILTITLSTKATSTYWLSNLHIISEEKHN